MKTINLELSQRLAPYLKDIETSYMYKYKHSSDHGILEKDTFKIQRYLLDDEYEGFDFMSDYKTLTLEEAIKFFRTLLDKNIEIDLYSTEILEIIGLGLGKGWTIESVEKTFIYLLDNNLLGKQ